MYVFVKQFTIFSLRRQPIKQAVVVNTCNPALGRGTEGLRSGEQPGSPGEFKAGLSGVV